MDFQGNKDTQNALDDILKRYLLEQDATTPEGEGLMEMAANSVLSNPATVAPSAAKEAEMLKKLQESFPESAIPGPTRPNPALKYGLFSLGAIAILSLAFLLFFNPFGTDKQQEIAGKENNKGLSGPALADNIIASTDDGDNGQESTSLLNGDGYPTVTLLPNEEKGTGKGIRSSAARRNLAKRLNATPIGQYSSDSRTGSNLSADDDPENYVFPKREMNPFPLRNLYSQTTTQSDYYQLDPNTDHLIRAQKGTVIHIPRNAFVDATSGESVSQTVQVEIKELYNRSEYLNSNIATISNDQQLIAGGVVYLNASAAGRRLQLAGDKSIYVEFSQHKEELYDMQLYFGDLNDKGEINLAAAGGKYNKLVPLPLEKLYFDEFWCDCSSEKRWNRQWAQLYSTEFINSWIATREFRQRLRVLRDMGYYEPGFQIYLDNTDKDLWKVDQMVAAQLKADAEKRKTNNDEVAYFANFSKQKLTHAESYVDYGLDLTRKDARRQLLYRKVSKEESERLIRLATLRANFIKDVEKRLIIGENGRFQGIRKGRFEKAGTKLVAGFLVHHLGWNLVSKPAKNEFRRKKKRDIKVRLTGNISYESTRAFMVFGDVTSILPGKPTTSQLFRFKKIPTSIDAWIVVIGFKHSMPYLGVKRIPRDRSGDKIVHVEMEETRFDTFFATLKALD